MATDAYQSTLQRLAARRRFGARPGLETVERILRALDDPQRSFRAIHIAGSKGKGSTAAFAEALLRAHRRGVGLYTSPHLLSFRERLQIDREPISREETVEIVEHVVDVADRLRKAGTIDRDATYFEITTAAAFHWFAQRKVSTAVIEVGLGGRLDATNVLDAPVGVITSIELEHTEILGDTLAAIAREKAGILRRGMRAVVGESKPEPREVIRRFADGVGVPVQWLGSEIRVDARSLDARGQQFDLRTPRRTLERVRIRLHGRVQPGNAALAVSAADLFLAETGGTLGEPALRRALSAAIWRGRLERLAGRPELWVDAAHTVESARELAASCGELFPMADPTGNVVLFGCLREKPAAAILERLAPLARSVVLAPISSDRSADARELRRAASALFATVVQAPTVADAVRLARAATDPDGFTLATGSDYLVAEVIASIEGAPSDEPDLSDPVFRTPGVGVAEEGRL